MKSSARILSLLVLVLILFLKLFLFVIVCICGGGSWGCMPQLHVEVRDLWGVSSVSILKWVPEISLAHEV